MKNNQIKAEIITIIVFTALIIFLCVFMVVNNFRENQNEINEYISDISRNNISSVEDYFSQIYGRINVMTENYTVNPVFYDDDSNKIIDFFAAECRQENFYAITLAEEEELLSTKFINGKGEIIEITLNDENFNKDILDARGRFVSNSCRIDGIDENVNFIYQRVVTPKRGRKFIFVAVIPGKEIENRLDESFFDGSGASVILRRGGGTVLSSSNYENYGNMEEFNNTNREGLISFKSKSGEDCYGFCSFIGDEKQWIAVTVIPQAVVKARINALTNTTVKISVCICSVVIVLFCAILICRQRDSKEIIKAAYTDDLTGHRNKQRFKMEADEILKSNRLSKYAIVILDLDNFKTFNELFGFDEGDRVLKYASDIINENIGEGEIFCRSNSDNFYMLIKYDSKREIGERLMAVMDEISLYKPSQNRNYKIVSYCGVYRIRPKHFEMGANFLIDRARLALMRIVRNHENGYAFYNEIFKNNIVFETELENDMEQALSDGDFKIYVQPKYDINNGSIAGGEALIRWQHKTKGFLTPNKFIELFERNHFITKLDFYVLKTICKMQKKWLDLGYAAVPVSVNQSKLDIFQDDYIDSILKIIGESGVPSELVELEITEDIAYTSFGEIVRVINELHKHGIKFSMDDFGSGYSSLNMLKNLDIDVIKLDKAFFDDGSENEKGRIIVSSSLEMAQRLNIKSVAEGVETKEHVEFLKTTSCNIAQGYYYSKPMPIEEFEKLLQGCKPAIQ